MILCSDWDVSCHSLYISYMRKPAGSSNHKPEKKTESELNSVGTAPETATEYRQNRDNKMVFNVL